MSYSKSPWAWLAGMLLCATLQGADATPSVGTTAAPPANASGAFSLDTLESYMQSPVAPSRSHVYKGDDANASYKKPEASASDAPIKISTRPIGSNAPLAVKPRPGSNVDRLADIATEDRNFFATLAKNSQAWPEEERDRRAQNIHDQYWLYLAEYPNDVNALVLYGKLLNHTGQRDAAFAAFLRADGLDPKIAVVKQQLANHLAENGSYTAALEMFRQAVGLDPGQALYHYQIGELLNFFYEGFLHDKIFTLAELNKTMEAEFGYAMALAPKVPAFAWRHAVCYYDMLAPDWNAALAAWTALDAKTTDSMEHEVIRLHRARILIELGRDDESRKLLAQPVGKNLEAVRAALTKRLEEAAAEKHASEEPKANPAPDGNSP